MVRSLNFASYAPAAGIGAVIAYLDAMAGGPVHAAASGAYLVTFIGANMVMNLCDAVHASQVLWIGKVALASLAGLVARSAVEAVLRGGSFSKAFSANLPALAVTVVLSTLISLALTRVQPQQGQNSAAH